MASYAPAASRRGNAGGGLPPWHAAEAQRGTRIFSTMEEKDASTPPASGEARPCTTSTDRLPREWHCPHCSTPPMVWPAACVAAAPVAWQPRHAAWIGGV